MVAKVESHRGQRPAGRIRTWGPRLAALAASLLLLVATLEVGLRVVGLQIPTATVLSAYFQYDQQTGWRGRPGAAQRFATANFDSWVTHDDEGFRTSGIETTLAEDSQFDGRAVWCVGDSMTWGWGVDDGTTYVDQLNRLAGPDVRFRNLGIPGYSTLQQYLQLQQLFSDGLRPDRVVVCFCWNDWSGNVTAAGDPPGPWVRVELGQCTLADWPVPASYGWSVRSWLLRNSQAFSFLNYHSRRAIHAVRQQRDRHAASARQATDRHAEPSPDEQIAMQWVLEQLRDLCAAQQVELTVFLPWPHDESLAAICGELGIEQWNGDREFDEYLASGQAANSLQFATDPHWTVAGHELVARAIWSHLRTEPHERIGDRRREPVRTLQ